MKFLFVTLFPEQIEQAASHSILQRAASKGLIEVSCINPRDFTHDVHRTVDDSPFGGGGGEGVGVGGGFRLTAAYYITWVAALVLMGIVLWRMFSKNTSKRYQENVKYLNLKNRVTGFFRRKISRIKQCKTHRFFKCPKCGQVVRTPKGKGTIRITCPKCRETFVRKS